MKMKTASNQMKRISCLTAGLLALALTTAQSQPPPNQPPATPPRNQAAPATGPTRFDLDFPGGTPAELVAAIQKANSRALNAIVPDDCANIKLPALKMKNVNVPELFNAVWAASRKTETVNTGQFGYGIGPSHTQVTTSYGFNTEGNNPTDDSIWYFTVQKPASPAASPAGPAAPEKICRFYSLAPYLERGVTVDDITTAIETGWRMLGDKSPPMISFHKDTKLLIAVGDPGKLEVIDAVLKAMGKPALSPDAKELKETIDVALQGLEGLKGLQGLQGLEALKALEGLKGLEDLKALSEPGRKATAPAPAPAEKPADKPKAGQ